MPLCICIYYSLLECLPLVPSRSNYSISSGQNPLLIVLHQLQAEIMVFHHHTIFVENVSQLLVYMSVYIFPTYSLRYSVHVLLIFISSVATISASHDAYKC